LLSQRPPWLAKKRVDPKNLEAKGRALRAEGKTLATLNGSFDLLHAGHLYIIHQASLQADVLFLLLNSDSSIQKYKRPDRPIISLKHRLEMVAALEFVSFVSFFDEVDPCAVLSKIRPDVHVNSLEYGSDCVESEGVRSFGGKLHLVDRIEALSTTAIVEKIQEIQCV